MVEFSIQFGHFLPCNSMKSNLFRIVFYKSWKISAMFCEPEKAKSAMTMRRRIFTLLKLSKRASIIRNTIRAKNAMTPIVMPNPHAFGSLFMGQVPFSYKSSQAIDAKTIIANTFFEIKLLELNVYLS